MSKNTCDGNCTDHEGDVQSVNVVGWGNFNYCQTAIIEDTNRGFTVEIRVAAQQLNQDAIRSDFESYIDDMIQSEVGLTQALIQTADGSYATSWVDAQWDSWSASALAMYRRLANNR